MPVNEFDGNLSWGYNPTFHNALDKYYGSPESFKAFVDECHARGIAVILDVVYNHTHEKSPLAMLYWDASTSKPAANNPWLNVNAPHDYSVFYDFNHESAYTVEYVEKTLKHWLKEYNIDGFRFDLSKGLTQNRNGQFGAYAYDASRIKILKNYADKIWQTSPGAYVILEHFTDNTEERELANYGMMLWSGFNLHNQYLEAAMGYPSNLSDINYKLKGWNEPNLIAYMESHDEERMVYKSLQYGNSAGAYNIKNLNTAISRAELASVFFYTVPGPKMLFQFGESGYDYSINQCSNGTLSTACRLTPKPIRWDYLQDPTRLKMFNTISGLMHLRKNYETFRTTNYNLSLGDFSKTIHLNHSSMNAAIIGNFDVNGTPVTPKFQHAGWWYDFFRGDSINVTDVNAPIYLSPGEYRLYLDRRIPRAPILTSIDDITPAKNDWTLFPNPSDGQSYLRLELEQKAQVRLQLRNMQGQLLRTITNGQLQNGTHLIPLTDKLVPGLYLVLLFIDDKVESRKLAVTAD
jgi:hypothetical protein